MSQLIRLLAMSLLISGSPAFAASASGASFESREGEVLGAQTATGDFFANVPYAQPPVNALRWKAPRPPLQRAQAWDGSGIDIKCAQVVSYFSGVPSSDEFGKPVGTEDCLYLNIWRPSQAKTKTLPVFVWFHGGSNRQGYASDPMYNGQALSAATEAVVITVNYRLGIFGALSHEALKTKDLADSSGNFVTLDLLRALNWIKANATSFGGDKNRVTIAGQSAGCMDVWGVMLSPLSKDLFQQAYCASGFPSVYPEYAARESSKDAIKHALVQKQRARDLDEASRVLERMTASEVKSFLYSLKTEELLRIPAEFLPVQHIADGYVLPSEGLAAVALGTFKHVSMIVSSTAAEGTMFYAPHASGLSAPDFWRVVTNQDRSDRLNDFVRSDSFARFQLQTARFTYGFEQLIDSVLIPAQYFPGKLFRLRWEWEPSSQPWRSVLGASHGIDLPFIFQVRALGPRHFFSFLNDDLKEKAATELGASFATYLKGYLHTGDPNAFRQGLPEWHLWNQAFPNNLSLGRDGIREEYRYFNPILGTYALTTAIFELSRMKAEEAKAL